MAVEFTINRILYIGDCVDTHEIGLSRYMLDCKLINTHATVGMVAIGIFGVYLLRSALPRLCIEGWQASGRK